MEGSGRESVWARVVGGIVVVVVVVYCEASEMEVVQYRVLSYPVPAPVVDFDDA